MKKGIGFDLGYTLVYITREKPYQLALREMGIERSLEQIERAHHFADKFFMREFQGILGKQPETYYPWYVGIVNHYLGVSVDLFAFCEKLGDQREKNKHWELFPWTKKVLQQLLDNNYRLFLLSNWDHSARRVLQYLDLINYFDEIIISSEIGYAKPDKKIFRLALDRLKLSASEVIYVGDNYYDDCIGSGKLGIDTLLINRFDKFGIEEITHPTVITDIRDVISFLGMEENKQVG